MQDKSIYRFTSFESLIGMVQSRTLPFVSLDSLEDPYEGFILKSLQTPEGKIKLHKIAQEVDPANIMTIMSLEFFYKTCHVQSWTKCEESDAMWRIYGHNNKALRIEVQSCNIAKLKDIDCKNVIYKDFKDLREEIESIVDSSGGKKTIKMGDIFIRKRTAFEHEKEVRLLTRINLSYLKQNKPSIPKDIFHNGLTQLLEMGEITEAELQTGLQNYDPPEAPNMVQVGFGHIENFIESVMVHPLAPNWYVDIVETYCKKEGIKFLGKSSLYTI